MSLAVQQNERHQWGSRRAAPRAGLLSSVIWICQCWMQWQANPDRPEDLHRIKKKACYSWVWDTVSTVDLSILLYKHCREIETVVFFVSFVNVATADLCIFTVTLALDGTFETVEVEVRAQSWIQTPHSWCWSFDTSKAPLNPSFLVHMYRVQSENFNRRLLGSKA